MHRSEWQPIETAPKDQVILLAYRADDEDGNEMVSVEAAIWDGRAFSAATPFKDAEIGIDWRGCSLLFAGPFAWMPLPPPPKGDTDNG